MATIEGEKPEGTAAVLDGLSRALIEYGMDPSVAEGAEHLFDAKSASQREFIEFAYAQIKINTAMLDTILTAQSGERDKIHKAMQSVLNALRRQADLFSETVKRRLEENVQEMSGEDDQ